MQSGMQGAGLQREGPTHGVRRPRFESLYHHALGADSGTVSLQSSQSPVNVLESILYPLNALDCFFIFKPFKTGLFILFI